MKTSPLILLPRCQDWYQGASSILCDVISKLTGVGRGYSLLVVPRLQKSCKVLFHFLGKNKGRAGECYIIELICCVLGASHQSINASIIQKNIVLKHAPNYFLSRNGASEPETNGMLTPVIIVKLKMVAIGRLPMRLKSATNNALNVAVQLIYRLPTLSRFGQAGHTKRSLRFAEFITPNLTIFFEIGGNSD